jgi:hypothetical protein
MIELMILVPIESEAVTVIIRFSYSENDLLKNCNEPEIAEIMIMGSWKQVWAFW